MIAARTSADAVFILTRVATGSTVTKFVSLATASGVKPGTASRSSTCVIPMVWVADEGLGVEPAEALFLDDRPENVEGGRAAGIHAEIFTTWEEFLERDRARYGLPEPRK